MMQNDTTSNTLGKVRISVEAIASIAGISAQKAEGVAGINKGFFGSLKEVFGAGKKNNYSGVKVEIGDKEVWIEIYISVKFGVDIPAVAGKVQDIVRENVESMTGLTVREVNVNIREITA